MSSVSTSTLLAHQGGWDEALFVAVPMIVVAVLLKLAKRRMAAASAAQAAAADEQRAEAADDLPETAPGSSGR